MQKEARQRIFKKITTHIGKGEKNSLARVLKVDESNDTINAHLARYKMKTAISEENTRCCGQALTRTTYLDKMNSKIEKKLY